MFENWRNDHCDGFSRQTKWFFIGVLDVRQEKSAKYGGKRPAVGLFAIFQTSPKTIAITLKNIRHPLFKDFIHWLIWNIPAAEKILNGLKNRGVEDIFIACTDNLTGFSSAIEAVFPKTEIQNCIIHQFQNSSKYVSYKDLKALIGDLKAAYEISRSWRENRPNLSTYFKFPQEVRRLIYTTNTIEGFNRQLRKETKAKSVFPTDGNLLKMLYLAMMDITWKWTGRRQDWCIIHAQLSICFEDRMPE